MVKQFCLIIAIVLTTVGCEAQPSSDSIQSNQQERLLIEATAQVGMPSIINFRERKIMKDILELRDQDGLVTYTYVFNEIKGEFVFLGQTIGYPIPYSTQFTNPERQVDNYYHDSPTLPQADPNGLFSPSSAEATWCLMKDPHSDKILPVYVEARVLCLPFRL